MSLYVGNLPPDCSEAFLYKKFAPVGKILSIKVCRDSVTTNSLGYAFVNFANEEVAKQAMDILNYDMMNGRIIRIMWAQKDPSKFPKAANLVIKNLDSDINESDLKEVFSSFGEILSIKVARTPNQSGRGDSKGYGFVQFAEEKAADIAMSSLQDEEIHGRKLSISKYIPVEERLRYQELKFPNNICVNNLTTTSTEELEKICEAFGDVVSARVMTDNNDGSRGFGFVSFKDKQSAERAVQELNRLCLNGKRLIAAFVRKKQPMKSHEITTA